MIVIQLITWIFGSAGMGGAAEFLAEHPHMSTVQIIGQLFAAAIVLALIITVIVIMCQVILQPRRSR